MDGERADARKGVSILVQPMSGTFLFPEHRKTCHNNLLNSLGNTRSFSLAVSRYSICKVNIQC